MTDKTGPLFVVGTPQETWSIGAMGYRVIAASNADAADVALKEQGNAGGCGAVLILNAETRGVWAEAFEQAGVHVAIPRAEEYATAIWTDDGGDMLRALLSRDYAEAVEHAEINKRQAREKALKLLHVFDGMGVAMDLCNQSVTREHIPTGLANLDKAIGGGLPEGALTVLGAGSSSGKTTLAVQIADFIAASGRTVLFVTTEQSRHELVAKSLSRMMKQTKKPNGGYYVASAEHIMSKAARASWGKDKEDALTTVEQIRKAYMALREKDAPNPVLVVDYLQLLKSKDEHMTDRRAIDVNVMELRQLARESNSAVILISSINRQSYSEGADMSAFKESGNIEFSADLAMMLQPRGYGEKVGKEKTDKAARERARELMAEHKGSHLRKSELVILKNRGGGMPRDPVPLMYDAMLNEFTEDNDHAAEATRKKPL